MKSSLRKTHLVLTSLIVMTVLFTFSCKKEGPCEAIITITDSAGVAVRGATVILRPMTKQDLTEFRIGLD